jgi:hypothetical protein
MRLRRGLFRLYVVLTMLWIGWFGYEIYAAQRSASKATDYIQMYDYERQIGRVPAFNRSELVVWQIQQTKRRETALQALLVFPLLAPVLFFIGNWVIRSFRRDMGPPQSAPPLKKVR